MGFRTGAFAKVWGIVPVSDTSTKLRISISRKNKKTDEYEQDFGGFVYAVGTAAAKKAACLKSGDTIKLGDVDVSNHYDSEKKREYTNCKIFSFDINNASAAKPASVATEPQPVVDGGELDDARLPF